MKELTVKYTDKIGYETVMDEIVSYLDEMEKQSMDQQPWPAYSYKPQAEFTVAHSGNCIFLQFKVHEKCIRAVNTNLNSAVWEDSCVEFFLAFNESGYYNFEFNCIGTALLGFGKKKEERSLLPEEAIEKIKVQAVVNRTGTAAVSWTLTVAIPIEVFIHDDLLSVKKKSGRANLYKCGDLLPEPHFLTWNNIHHPEPNFHLPAYFGIVNFE